LVNVLDWRKIEKTFVQPIERILRFGPVSDLEMQAFAQQAAAFIHNPEDFAITDDVSFFFVKL